MSQEMSKVVKNTLGRAAYKLGTVNPGLYVGQAFDEAFDLPQGDERCRDSANQYSLESRCVESAENRSQSAELWKHGGGRALEAADDYVDLLGPGFPGQADLSASFLLAGTSQNRRTGAHLYRNGRGGISRGRNGAKKFVCQDECSAAGLQRPLAQGDSDPGARTGLSQEVTAAIKLEWSGFRSFS